MEFNGINALKDSVQPTGSGRAGENNNIKKFGIKGGKQLAALKSDVVSFGSNDKGVDKQAGLKAVEAGEEAIVDKDYEFAILCFDEAIENGIITPNSFHKRAFAKLQLGMFEESIADYTSALDIKEPLENTYRCRGNAKIAYKNSLPKAEIEGEKGKELFESAVKDYERAIELKPKARTYADLGEAVYGVGDYSRAREAFGKAIELGSASPNAYHKKAFSEMRLGMFEESIADYTSALDIKEPLENTYRCRGNARIAYRNSLPQTAENEEKRQELLDGAIADFERAIELKPKAATYKNFADAIYSNADYERAVELYEKGIEAGDKSADTYHKKAYSEAQLGHYEEAVEDYTNALAVNPKLYSTQHLRGVARMKQSAELPADIEQAKQKRTLISQAIGDFKASIEIRPTCPAYDSLADAYARLGGFENYTKGAEAYEKSAEIVQQSIENLEQKLAQAKNDSEKAALTVKLNNNKRYLAKEYARQGIFLCCANDTPHHNDPKAYELFTKAIELEPKNADYHFRLGKVSESLTESIQHFSEAISLNPNVPAYYDALGNSIGASKTNFKSEEERMEYCRAYVTLQKHSCSPDEVSKADYEKAKAFMEAHSNKYLETGRKALKMSIKSSMLRHLQEKMQEEQEITEQETEQQGESSVGG